jgi:hypothetical protein
MEIALVSCVNTVYICIGLNWNQLPEDVLGTLSCKPCNFRKRVRKVINKAKWRGDHRKGSEVK